MVRRKVSLWLKIYPAFYNEVARVFNEAVGYDPRVDSPRAVEPTSRDDILNSI